MGGGGGSGVTPGTGGRLAPWAGRRRQDALGRPPSGARTSRPAPVIPRTCKFRSIAIATSSYRVFADLTAEGASLYLGILGVGLPALAHARHVYEVGVRISRVAMAVVAVDDVGERLPAEDLP